MLDPAGHIWPVTRHGTHQILHLGEQLRHNLRVRCREAAWRSSSSSRRIRQARMGEEGHDRMNDDADIHGNVG